MKRIWKLLLVAAFAILAGCTGSDGDNTGSSVGNSPGDMQPGQPIPETSPFYRGWIKFKLNGQTKGIYRLPVVANRIRTLSLSGRMDNEDLKLTIAVPRTGLGEKTYTEVGALELENEMIGTKLKSSSLTLKLTEIGNQVGQYVRGTFSATMTVKQVGTTAPFTVPEQTVTEGEFALLITGIETLAGNYEMFVGTMTPMGGVRDTYQVRIIESEGMFFIDAPDRPPVAIRMPADARYEWDWPVRRDGITVGQQRHEASWEPTGMLGKVAGGYAIYTTSDGVQSLQPVITPDNSGVLLTRLSAATQ